MILRNVQALRAIAALAVAGFHLGNAAGLERRFFPPGPVLTSPLGFAGSFGVDLFFAISGFIMVTTAWNEFATPRASERFFLRRIARIYPPYWFALLAVLAVYLVAPGIVNAHGGKPDLLASFLLLPQTNEPLLLVSWSLVFEMEFYALFALALLRPRRELPFLVAAWIGSVALLGVVAPSMHNAYIDFFRSALPLEFVCGMIAGAAFAQNKLAAPAAWLAGGVAAGALAIYALRTYEVPYDAWVHPISVGASAAAVVFGSAALEKRCGIAAPFWAVVLGDASYAIYLWHVPVLGALVRVVAPVTPPGVVPRVLAIAVMFAITIAVGIAVYKYVERPLTRALNRRIAAATGTASA